MAVLRSAATLVQEETVLAPAAQLTDHALLDLADQLQHQYVGAVPAARVLDAVIESSHSLRRSALTGVVLTELLEQSVRRTLTHEIAMAGLESEPV